MHKHKQKWETYRDTRKGTYEFRARTRYFRSADSNCPGCETIGKGLALREILPVE